MDLLQKRHRILQAAHRCYLKPKGFSLRGLRSESHSPPLQRCLVVHSQPSNTTEHVDFDLLITIAHDQYRPNARHGVRPGLGLHDEALLSLSLCRMADKGAAYWSLADTRDDDVVEAAVHRAVENYAAPIFDRTRTVEGVCDLILELCEVRAYKPRSWALDRLGERHAALDAIKAAFDSAPNENARRIAAEWLATFDGNRSAPA